jgi:hypothetical protein
MCVEILPPPGMPDPRSQIGKVSCRWNRLNLRVRFLDGTGVYKVKFSDTHLYGLFIVV